MRTLLVLARISNLPTVWSNCFAASLLVGTLSGSRLLLLCAAGSLLYTGGMFLNDAVDQGFDRQYRPERPIVAGKIRPGTVWVVAVLLLAVGWGSCFWLGKPAAVLGSLLLITIVWYDLVHKRTQFAPLLMAACRFLLYLMAAAAVTESGPRRVWLPGLALAVYIVGLSYLARRESTGGVLSRWPLVFLLAPAAVAVASGKVLNGAGAVTFFIQLAWTFWCVGPLNMKIPAFPPRGVAGLLAGIVLVDWLAVCQAGQGPMFLSLFVIALFSQRIAPAT